MPPEPLFWLHFFRARPTTFSVASKRTREHAKGHAMLRVCARESSGKNLIWWESESQLPLFAPFAQLLHFASHGDNIFINKEMACWCYAGCSCWRTHSQKKSAVRQQLRANCSFAPSFHLTDDAECRIASCRQRAVWCYRSKKLANLEKWSCNKNFLSKPAQSTLEFAYGYSNHLIKSGSIFYTQQKIKNSTTLVVLGN